MSGNPAFEKALMERLGDAVELLNCKECGTELIECPHCHNMICPEGCDLK